MFKNYVVTAIRNLLRNKIFAIINIGGLALALAASILIMLFVRYETGFENWLKDSSSIYRIETEMHFPGREPMEFSYSPGPMKGLLEKEFPGEIAATTWMRNERTGVAFGDRRFIERVSYVNSTFFEVFDLQAISGAREGGLQDTSSILISERMAEKYFGNKNPVGQILVLDNQLSVRVAGVFENIPDNSHLVLDFLMRLDPVNYKNSPWVLERWGSVNLFTYFRLREKEGLAPPALARAS
ncbi:MAG: ABC transporter permease [Proteobacteria bacterium]|nr:ABC transporter permease [Pseudomonadota bacterium]